MSGKILVSAVIQEYPRNPGIFYVLFYVYMILKDQKCEGRKVTSD